MREQAAKSKAHILDMVAGIDDSEKLARIEHAIFVLQDPGPYPLPDYDQMLALAKKGWQSIQAGNYYTEEEVERMLNDPL